MEYADPHHKRTEFVADSISSTDSDAGHCIAFAGQGAHRSVILQEQGPCIVAVVPEADCELVLWKAQILEKSKWLTLDFEDNPQLRRILIHIDRLDPDALDAAIKLLIGRRSLPYFRHRG